MTGNAHLIQSSILRITLDKRICHCMVMPMYDNSCQEFFLTKPCRLMEILKEIRYGQWNNLVMNSKDHTLAVMET